MPPGVHVVLFCLRQLHRPAPESHKGDNGRLLIIAGSKKYHGSVVLAATMASKLVDLVYLATTPDNFSLIKKVRERLAEFIYIAPRELPATLTEVDAVLIGPGLLPNAATRRLVQRLLRQWPDKKIILDAAALRVLDPRWLPRQCIITPHAGEFRALFRLAPTPPNVQALSRRYPGVIVLKGRVDYLAQGGRLWYNTAGNAGMTKGGTGDVLAGLIAALATKNDPLLAAQAGVYVNGLAGDKLYKKVGYHYSASELMPEIRKILSRFDY
ncbi:MAG: NAD(P)H-hydrate dehydratase [Candidatus Magasanikbacteria bacterium]|nr:NAD(P)H-hydrate dehydratase [Candidatus Magasanikbacteria bacterium]